MHPLFITHSTSIYHVIHTSYSHHTSIVQRYHPFNIQLSFICHMYVTCPSSIIIIHSTSIYDSINIHLKSIIHHYNPFNVSQTPFFDHQPFINHSLTLLHPYRYHTSIMSIIIIIIYQSIIHTSYVQPICSQSLNIHLSSIIIIHLPSVYLSLSIHSSYVHYP